MKPVGREDILGSLRKAAVVGTSTGTPLAVKLAEPTPILIVNAVEGEPSFTAYTLLMERSARELTEGMRMLGDLGFRRVILAVNEWTIDESDALIDRASDGGFEVAEVPGDFREAGEAGIVRETLRRPAEAGTAGVTVISLESVWHAQRAVYRNRPMTTKLVQMAGALETSHVFEAPVGALVADLGALAGAPAGAQALPISAHERLTGLAALSGDARDMIEKTTDMVLVIDPEIPGPPELALETMTPAKGIEDVADRIRRVRVALASYEGQPQAASVKPGDPVRKGQPLATSAAGVDAHAPFDGTVAAVTRAHVEIAR